MRKFILGLVISLFFVTSLFAKTVKIGNTVYLSGEKQLTIICDIQDNINGVGMGEGTSQFKVKYEDDTVTEWLPKQKYSDTVILTLDVVEGKKFTIQGLFADSLGNEMLTPLETPQVVILDESVPSGGTINIKIDITINVT